MKIRYSFWKGEVEEICCGATQPSGPCIAAGSWKQFGKLWNLSVNCFPSCFHLAFSINWSILLLPSADLFIFPPLFIWRYNRYIRRCGLKVCDRNAHVHAPGNTQVADQENKSHHQYFCAAQVIRCIFLIYVFSMCQWILSSSSCRTQTYLYNERKKQLTNALFLLSFTALFSL